MPWFRRCIGPVALIIATAAVGAVPLSTGDSAVAADVSSVSAVTGISCPTVSTCVISADGDGAEVLATHDGGRTWRGLAGLAEANSLAGVSCPTARRCEVVGSGGGDAGAVYGTDDGGESWTAPAPLVGGGLLFAVACPTVRMCEVTGNAGSIFGTVDGGRNWTAQSVPSVANLVEAVTCPTTTDCEAVGYVGDGAALRTEDGGSTWVTQDISAAAQQMQGIACPTVRTCVAVGMDTVHSGTKQLGVIFTTSNGGLTWRRRPVPAGITDLNGVACPTPNQCVAVGLGGDSILYTNDSGVTWTAETTPESVFLLGVACPSTTVCEAVGEDQNDSGVVLASRDGGQTWKSQSLFG